MNKDFLYVGAPNVEELIIMLLTRNRISKLSYEIVNKMGQWHKEDTNEYFESFKAIFSNMMIFM